MIKTTNFWSGNINFENYENARENKIKNVPTIDLNNIIMSENIQEPNNDDMKINEDEIDEIIRKGTKKNLRVKILEKKKR